MTSNVYSIVCMSVSVSARIIILTRLLDLLQECSFFYLIFIAYGASLWLSPLFPGRYSLHIFSFQQALSQIGTCSVFLPCKSET